ncbi:hypothetical protein ACODNH_00310 (plasmid) [Haloarcula sp. NS06]|uniref:hypothetical protein n=1 Tax=Haloarcula sp. NS06 TaxID=3409688 RepID=UPI003DA7899A
MVRRNHTSLFRVGAFIRLTAETEEDLRKQTNRLETLLRDSPSNCGVKRTTRRQEAGLVTVSPIGANELGQNRLSSMTGEALGFAVPVLVELPPDGGWHRVRATRPQRFIAVDRPVGAGNRPLGVGDRDARRRQDPRDAGSGDADAEKAVGCQADLHRPGWGYARQCADAGCQDNHNQRRDTAEPV